MLAFLNLTRYSNAFSYLLLVGTNYNISDGILR